MQAAMARARTRADREGTLKVSEQTHAARQDAGGHGGLCCKKSSRTALPETRGGAHGGRAPPWLWGWLREHLDLLKPTVHTRLIVSYISESQLKKKITVSESPTEFMNCRFVVPNIYQLIKNLWKQGEEYAF